MPEDTLSPPSRLAVCFFVDEGGLCHHCRRRDGAPARSRAVEVQGLFIHPLIEQAVAGVGDDAVPCCHSKTPPCQYRMAAALSTSSQPIQAAPKYSGQSSGVVVFYLVQHRAQILVKVNAVDRALMSDGVDILIGGVDQQLFEVVRLAAVFPPFADLRIGAEIASTTAALVPSLR